MTDPTASTDPAEAGLDPCAQRRNIAVYTAIIALIYLAAPVLYVGFVQAALCKRLNTSDTVANLPSTVYLGTAWFPILLAWVFPQARLLKPLLTFFFGVMAVGSALLAGILLAPVPDTVIVGALIGHAALLGCANGAVFTLSWEALSRGVSAGLLGRALGLAFGWGPAFAVLGSLVAQTLLEGKLFGRSPPSWLIASYPQNYALLYAGTAASMGLAAFLVRLYRIPVPAAEPPRQMFGASIRDGFRALAGHRVLLIACAAYLLVSAGNTIQNNMSLFTGEAVGRSPEDLAGYQLSLRFSCKMLAGFLLGWLLARTNPKVPLLVTVGLQIAAVAWVLFVPGYWFLLAFGLNGAAELCGVYYMNYPVQCSAKADVRRNIAFIMLVSSVVGLAPLGFGWISDHASLQASFYAALVLLTFTAVLVAVKLPAHPSPR